MFLVESGIWKEMISDQLVSFCIKLALRNRNIENFIKSQPKAREPPYNMQTHSV